MKRIMLLSFLLFTGTQLGASPARYYVLHTISSPFMEFCLRKLGLQNTVHLSTAPAAQKKLNVKTTTQQVIQTNPTLAAALYTLISATHMYASYMLPQWVDTHALRLPTKRSTAQNIASFAWRNVNLALEPQLEVDVNVGNAGFNLNSLHRNFVAELVASSLVPRLTNL